MNYISSLNETQREEIITKCKESLRYRVNELESAYQEKDKQCVKLMDDYMNEKNLRATAEAVSREAERKLEEMQRAIDEYEVKTLELETQVARYYMETIAREEGQEIDLDGEDELEKFKERYTQLQKNAQELEELHDQVIELEQTLQTQTQDHLEYRNDTSKEIEWLSSLLEKERKMNEKLSSESDLRSAEFQKNLEEINEQNLALNKWKSENTNNGKLLQDLTEKHRVIVSKLEMDKVNLHKELKKARQALALLKNGEKGSCGIADQEKVASDSRRKDSPGRRTEIESDGNSGEEIEEQNLNHRYGNLGYRSRLSKMIQNGMNKLRKK